MSQAQPEELTSVKVRRYYWIGARLPSLAAGSYRQFRRAFPSEGVRVVARITEAGPHKARADVDFLDDGGQPVARIEDYECVIDASLQSAFRRSRAAQVESK